MLEWHALIIKDMYPVVHVIPSLLEPHGRPPGRGLLVPSFGFAFPRQSHANLQEGMRMEEKTRPGLWKELKHLLWK